MNKTQHNILNAAFEVLAQDFSAPLEKIAERAGVTRATLHRYYNSREALMEGANIELCRLTKAVIDEATASHDTPVQQLKAVVMKSAELGHHYHFLMHAMEHEQHDPKFQYVEQQLADLIDAVRQKGFIRPDVPTPWIIHVYYGLMSASWRALKDGGVAPKQIPDLAWQTFTSGLFVDGRG